MAVIKAARVSGSLQGTRDRSSRTSSVCRRSGQTLPRLCQIPRATSQRKGAVMPTCPRRNRYQRDARPPPVTKRVLMAQREGIRRSMRRSRAKPPLQPGLKTSAVALWLSQLTWRSWKTHPASIALMALASTAKGIGMRRRAHVPRSFQTTNMTTARGLRNSSSSTPHTSARTRSHVWLALSDGLVRGTRGGQR